MSRRDVHIGKWSRTETQRTEGLVNDQQWLLIALKRLSVDLVVFEHLALNGKDGKSLALREQHSNGRN